MKLNYDCVRDVLLSLEETLTIIIDNGEFSYNSLSPNNLIKLSRLSEYSMEDVIYSVLKLGEAGYIKVDINESGSDLLDICISDIEYEGHEFLQAIKSDTVWNDVKRVAKKIGSISLPIISSIASSVLSKLITKTMGLP